MCNQDVFRVSCYACIALNITGRCVTQVIDTRIRNVARVSLTGSSAYRLYDMLWGIEVGLSDLEVYDVLCGPREIHDLPDSRTRYLRGN